MMCLLKYSFIIFIRMPTVKDSAVLNVSILKLPHHMKRESTIEELHNTWRKMGT